ncbi:MAG: SdiA-regulated domain-containing protein [Patescibacteria group bacterium]|nr:SdiA-regulated domain-containing protein [Patescibacteria group bacterium]
MTKKLSLILALIFGLFFLSNFSHAANTWPAGTGTDIGGNLPPDPIVYEPSGLAWHSRLGTLFIVGDSGNISEITSDGSLLHNWYNGSFLDLEGIAVANPASNYVYVGEEGNRTIYEFDITSWTLSGKSWDLSAWMPDVPGQGLEALTFVPNGDHPYTNSSSGGLFYAGHQGDGKIYVFDINLSLSGSVNYISTITPLAGTTDLSGLDYEPSTQILYAIFDSSDLLLEMNASGTVLNSYDMPGSAQEGVAVQSNKLSKHNY